MTRETQVDLPTPSETDRLGARLARVLRWPLTVALSGSLGAGKTHFVRAVCRELGVPPHEVTSPTYVLLQRYPTNYGPIYHLDFYRLNSVDEAYDLGLDEMWTENALVFIEWADRFPEVLPDDRLDVELAVSERGRTAMLTATGVRSVETLTRLVESAR